MEKLPIVIHAIKKWDFTELIIQLYVKIFQNQVNIMTKHVIVIKNVIKIV